MDHVASQVGQEFPFHLFLSVGGPMLRTLLLTTTVGHAPADVRLSSTRYLLGRRVES